LSFIVFSSNFRKGLYSNDNRCVNNHVHIRRKAKAGEQRKKLFIRTKKRVTLKL
jgi:hypothetical protein